MFPAMSDRNAERVREELVDNWPERYQTMPVFVALRRLYETGRVYKERDDALRSNVRWRLAGPRTA